MRRVALAATLLLSLAACREDFFDPTPGGTGPAAEPRVELRAQNVRLLTGESNAIRFGFQARGGTVHVRVDRSDANGRIVACPLRSIEDPIPAVTACLPDLPNGVREGITLTGLGAVALVREGPSLTLNIVAEYAEAGRSVRLRFPVVPVPAGASACKDNACNPFFELSPVQSGSFTATARWSGGGGANLSMLAGRVLARAFTSTGIPYRIAGQREGASPLSLTAQLDAPSEYALALRNVSGVELTQIEIDASWP